MKNFISLCFLIVLFLSGCQLSSSQHVEIDWVDFIKWEGKVYDGIYPGALADESFIGKKVGEIKFKVADNVSDPEYKLKNGDAAFHKKGTEIFAVKGYPGTLAVKSNRAINHYQLYFDRDKVKDKWQFKDLSLEMVNKVEIYEAYTADGPKPVNEINRSDKINRLLDILNNSKVSPNFEPIRESGDPKYYKIVLYI